MPDSAEDREVKWRRFQSGQYDCAIVPYSFFGSIGLRTEAWRQFALKTPLLARKLSLEARDLEETVSRALERERTGKDPEPPRISDKRASDFVGEDRWEAASLEEREAFRTEVQKEVMRANYERDKRLIALTDKLASLSERSQALMAESLENYAAEKAAATAANGITFEEIGIDFLLVDEAQNFKNIWAVGQLDGGNPKYLGAIQSGSERGIQLAAYRSNLSQRLGTPGGTYLLSATPAKNSPIEYFTLINLVNERAWADVGVPTVESFIYRYLYIERRDVIQPDMEVKEQSVVAGFQNLVELRDVIFRYAEFKTAKDVGLKLPESKSETILVDMEPDQQAMYYELASFYQSTLHQLGVAQGGPKANRLKNRALSLLTKMQLATIHPLLATGPQTPEHTAFIDLPYDHPDVPTEERERRLLLLTLARRDPIGGQIDSLYRDLLQSADSEVLSRFRIAGEPLYEAAKKKFAKKRKLKTQFTYSSAVNAANYHSPKLDKCVEFIASNPNCGQIVFCDNVAVHRWLVELLVEAGIVRSRIAVINGEVAKDAMKRLDISDKFNGIPAVVAPDGTIEVEEVSPSFDVVIANQAAYEGIDLHRRTCMVYHLDLPWEPSTLRQRNGRAVRQGNLESNVSIRFLMARRSLDVVRYEYILGKLRWMSDLIESTDNSLSNPAADSEIDSESLVLFMSRDEDEAKAAIATLRAQQEAKRRRQIATRAWRDLEAVQQRRRSLRMLDTADSGLTPAEQSERRIVLVEDIRRITAGLVSLSPESWPFAWVVQLERPFVIEHDRMQNTIPIVEDWTLGGKIEFGRLSPGEFGWRRFGDVRWHRKSLAEDDDELAELLLTGYEPEDTRTQPRYPVEDLHGQLALLLEELRTTGTFELLGLKLCSARWRARLHSDKHWSSIVAALRQTSLDFQVPIRPPGGGWKLVDSDDPQVTEETLAPFDRATYSSFFSWASTNRTSLTYSATALTTEAWWGIRFPVGTLAPGVSDLRQPSTRATG